MNMKVFPTLIIASLACAIAACSPSQPATPNSLPAASSTSTMTITPTPTFSPTPTVTPTPTITPTPTPMGGGDRLLYVRPSFEYATRDMPYAMIKKYPDIGYERKDYPNLRGDMNVFISNLVGMDVVPVTTNGLDGFISLGDVSPDGKKVFAVSASLNNIISGYVNLYVLDLAGPNPAPKKITRYGQTAMWVDNNRFVYIGMVGGKVDLFLTDMADSEPINLSKGNNPLVPLSIGDGTGIYWEAYEPSGLGVERTGIWWSSLDGAEQRLIVKFTDNMSTVNTMSPDGTTIVWGNREHDVNIALLNNVEKFNSFSAPVRVDTQWPRWSPDGAKIYYESERWIEERTAYLFDVYTCSFTKLPDPPARDDGSKEKIEGAWWSPDGKHLIVNFRIFSADGFGVDSISRIYDLESNTYGLELPQKYTYQKIWLPDLGQPQPIISPAPIPSNSACTYR